jgi:hypothetical protein
MDFTPSNQPPLYPVRSGYFTWEPAGKKIAVHLSGDAVDQINQAVLGGFGALPKRGAEVGGLLLGTVEKGEKLVVWIEGFSGIQCAHLHGPSYILCEDDMPALDRELEAYSADSSARLRVVGFLRSHTREPIRLEEADLALLDARFPDEDAICLLVKPFTMQPSQAVFLIREGGLFSGETQDEAFVFRRKEMQLPPAPERERGSTQAALRPTEPAGDGTQARRQAIPEGPPTQLQATDPALDPERAPELDMARMSRRRFRRSPRPATGAALAGSELPSLRPDPQSSLAGYYGEDLWPSGSSRMPAIQERVRQAPVSRYWKLWLPLSLISLLLGVLAGVVLSRTRDPSQSQAVIRDPYELGLRVSRTGASFKLKWNPEMLALRQARSGELRIEEGTASKTQQLSADELARGAILYHGTSAPGRFRLTLFLRNRASFSETVETQPETR